MLTHQSSREIFYMKTVILRSTVTMKLTWNSPNYPILQTEIQLFLKIARFLCNFLEIATNPKVGRSPKITLPLPGIVLIVKSEHGGGRLPVMIGASHWPEENTWYIPLWCNTYCESYNTWWWIDTHSVYFICIAMIWDVRKRNILGTSVSSDWYRPNPSNN